MSGKSSNMDILISTDNNTFVFVHFESEEISTNNTFLFESGDIFQLETRTNTFQFETSNALPLLKWPNLTKLTKFYYQIM